MLYHYKNPVISIFSCQTTNGQVEKFEFSAPCRCCIDSASVVGSIAYDEIIDGCHTSCFIKIEAPHSISVLRKGRQSVKLIFEENQHHVCTYFTEAGNFDLGVLAHNLICVLGVDHCHIDIQYSLDTGGAALSENEISIDIREDDEYV